MAADNLDNPSLGNFSIEDTMEMGAGNRELLDTLFSPDSATASPEDVTILEKEPKQKAKTTTNTTTKAPEKKEDVEEGKDVKDFLFGEEEEEEETDEVENKAPAKKKEEKTEDGEEEEDDAPANPFNSISKELFKLGVFNKDEEEEEVEISTPEQFLERFKSEKQKGAIEIVDRFISQFGDDYRGAFEAIFVKGVNPKEYFGTYNSIKEFSDTKLKV